MKSHKNFKRSVLAKSVMLVLGSSMILPALAQEANDDTEVILVKGIRGSLIQSMDVKRESAGIVDAITAEDIGKFPDSNLAESLQRITGVSIDRRNGEGFQVSVRGFGPEFNQVTLNGRSLPAAQLGERGLVPNRAFDMSNIASEGVSGVTVYKSGMADITSGGIGATVDLQTRKPFQTEGFTGSVGGKILHDTTNRTGSDYTPELSTYLSYSDDVWGVSLSASHQRRDSGQTGAFTNLWNFGNGPFGDISGVPNGVQPGIVVANAPAAGQQTNFTPTVRYNQYDYERERQNAQLTLQFRPAENVEATLDYTYAKQDNYARRAELNTWFGGGAWPNTGITFAEQDGVSSPLYQLTAPVANGSAAGDYTTRDVNFSTQGIHAVNKLESLGLNIKWEASDDLTITFDAHDSESSALPGDSGPGNFYNAGFGAQGVAVAGLDFSGDLPLFLGVWSQRDDPGLVRDEIDVGDLSSTVNQITNNRAWSDTTQVRVDFDYQLNDEVGIDFGIESRDLSYSNKGGSGNFTLTGGWGAANPGEIPADMIEEFNFFELFDGHSGQPSSEATAFFNQAYDGAVGQLEALGATAYIAKDPNELGAFLAANAGLPWAAPANDSVNRLIEEDVFATYFQAHYEGEAGDMMFRITAGIRFESTDATSTSQIAPANLVWNGDNDIDLQGGSAADAVPVIAKADYNSWLPSFTFSLDVTEDIVTRFSYSKTIARADYDKLQQGLNQTGASQGSPLVGANLGTGANGNIGLLPVESNNIDLSVEWYYDEGSYVSVGYFFKDAPNFIGLQTEDQQSTLTRDPTVGPRAQAAITELNNRGLDVNQQNIFRMIASLDNGQGGCINTGSSLCGADFNAAEYEGANGWENGVDLVALAEDPFVNLETTLPVNANGAEIDGWELAVQHFFGETGFGIQANATLVDGDIGFNVADTTGLPQFALTGLSDSANLVLLYEKDNLQARITYNWRDAFLDSTDVGGNEPQFTEEYSQIDFSIGYNITEDWSVSLEGINITDEDVRQYGRSELQVNRLQILGARYALSTRYSF